MNGLKTLGVGLAVLTLLFAVPVSALTLLYAVGSGSHAKTVTASMPQMASDGMSGIGITSSSPTTLAAAAAGLTIIHVQKGCHVWSNGSAQMPMMRVTLHAGQTLRIMNQDLDMHRMVEVAGPAQMMLGGAMKQGQAQTLTFGKSGIYRFMTKVSPMAGMPDVATTGPDNTLQLSVKVG